MILHAQEKKKKKLHHFKIRLIRRPIYTTVLNSCV
jgi:hypothetical protein